LKFKCLRHDNCCYFSSLFECPVVFEDEKERLERLGRKLNVKVRFEEVQDGVWKFVIDGFCGFYDREAKICRIHEVKPLACKMFPLILDPKNKLILVSRACKWVNENWNVVTSNPVQLVFPEEYEIAVKAYFRFLQASRKEL